MAPLFFFLLLVAIGESQAVNQINQTDLQAAMNDMRMQSYHGFVILLKILNNFPNSSLQNKDITFFMPNNQELSEVSFDPDQLQDFILSHSIPTALHLNQLLHFPNGTLVPSNMPDRMISITNTRRLDLLVNNARIVTPNVCSSSFIRCHGISATIAFNNSPVSSPEALPIIYHRPAEAMARPYGRKRANPSITLKAAQLPLNAP